MDGPHASSEGNYMKASHTHGIGYSPVPPISATDILKSRNGNTARTTSIMSTTTEKTRAVLEPIFLANPEQGLGPKFRESLSDHLTWTATGSSPVAGTYHPKETYITKVWGPLHEKLAGAIKPIKTHRMIVEGEWASVFLESFGVKGKNGSDFSMQYNWLVRVVDGKILEVIGFYDQTKMNNLFA